MGCCHLRGLHVEARFLKCKAARDITGGGLLQHMGTNTFCAPGYLNAAGSADAAAGVGCLGMAGGSSSDPAVLVGKGKGKGKGKKDRGSDPVFPKKTKKPNLNSNIDAHVGGQSKLFHIFCKGLPNLRDMMPTEDAKAASSWASAKLIKCMGEAKMLVIRLASVKHQEKLSAFSEEIPTRRVTIASRTGCIIASYFSAQEPPSAPMRRRWSRSSIVCRPWVCRLSWFYPSNTYMS